MRTSDRPVLWIALGALLSVLLPGCGGDDGSPTDTPLPNLDQITGLRLEDELGLLAAATTDSVYGTISLCVNEAVTPRIVAVTPQGALDPREGNDGVNVTVEVRRAGVVEATIRPGDPPTVLRAVGLSADTTSLRLRVSHQDSVVFATPWIPVQVDGPAVVDSLSGLLLFPPQGDAIYREFGSWSSNPLFFERGGSLQVSVEFTSPNGLIVPQEQIGRRARLEMAPSPPGFLGAPSMVGAPFAFELSALAVGQGRLGFRLMRGDRQLYASSGPAVQVVQPAHVGWTGVPEGFAPNGTVHDLIPYEGQLAVAGDFTRVGLSEAIGVALWDGNAWSAMGGGLPDVRHLLSEGDLLVAISAGAGGAFRWTGTDWALMAPLRPDALAVGLYQGEIVVTGSRIGVQAWRGGQWVQLSEDRYSGRALAEQAGRLYFGGSYLSGAMLFETAFLRYLAGADWNTAFEEGCGDNCSISVDYLKSHGDNLILGLSSGSPGGEFYRIERLNEGQRRPIAEGVPIHGSALLGGRIYVLDGSSNILVQEDLGLRELATVPAGRIYDIEEYGGELFAAGSFTEIDGKPAFHLARWAP